MLFIDLSDEAAIKNARFSRGNIHRTYLAFLLAVTGQPAVEVAGAGGVVAPAGGIGENTLQQAAPKES